MTALPNNAYPTLSGSSLTASQSPGLSWLTQPTPQTVEAGSSVSFTCEADHSDTIQLYEWQRNNLPLPEDDRYTLKNGGQTLEISQTKFEDRGEYRCVATRNGKVLGRSQNAALNVEGTRYTTLLSRNLGRSSFGGRGVGGGGPCHLYSLITTHNDLDSTDPSRMQDACHI